MGKYETWRNPYSQDEIKTSLQKKEKKSIGLTPTLMKSEGHEAAPECSLMAAVKMFLSGLHSERLINCWLPVNSFIHRDKRKISVHVLPLFMRKGLNF